MTTARDRKKQDLVFALVERAAVMGQRCPTNDEIAQHLQKSGAVRSAKASSVPKIMGDLIRQGRLTVRVYANNYRDVVINDGPHTGKATTPPAHGRPPYSVIDRAERERRDKSPPQSRYR